MRKLALAFSTALIAAPVFAVQMEGNYFNSNMGAALQPNITYHATNNSDANGNRYLATENKTGSALDLSYGYQTEDLRVEGSLIYLQNKLKKSFMRSTYFDINGAPAAGTSKVIGLMANGMYDFDSESDFTPYIGFGVGGIRISQNIKGFPSFSITSADTDIETTTCISRNTVITPGATSTTTTTIISPTTTTTTDTTAPTSVTTSTDTTTITTQIIVKPVGISPSLPAGVTVNNSGTISVNSTTAPTPTVLPSTGCGLPVASTGSLPPMPNAASYADDNQLQFAYQTIIGMSYKIMDDIKLSADYRYLRAMPTTFTVVDAGEKVPMKGSYSNHRFMLGMTVFF